MSKQGALGNGDATTIFKLAIKGMKGRKIT
jgi:hypothetical protein